MTSESNGWSLPDEEYMANSDGLPENHHYRDMRWMEWSDYDMICRDAEALIELMEWAEDEDELYEEAQDNMVYYMDLDPEVAPVVAALAASGAVPFTSCSGNPGHYESYPLVGFWAPESLRVVVGEAAADAEVELEVLGMGALLVFHQTDSAPMRSFAERLKERSEVVP